MSFRWIITVTLTLALGWSAYWWVGAGATRAGVEGWLSARAAEGWVANYDDLTVAGYPNRFDTTLTALDLADPAEGWAWSAPAFQILSLSYDPGQVILAFPGVHTVATPRAAIAIEGQTLRASARITLAQEVESLILEADALALTGAEGGAVAERLVLASEAQGNLREHRLGLDARTVSLTGAWRETLDPAGILPEIMQSARLDALATYSDVPGLPALSDRAPAFDALDITDLQITWGELDLRAQGSLVADAAGFAEGSVRIRARNWRQMLDAAVAAGLVDAQIASTAEMALGLIADLSGDPHTLNADLTFRGGIAALGPIPIGEAPRLRP
ncbi:MAG: DUF2125 domain-containing protein [Rubricella sp.]